MIGRWLALLAVLAWACPAWAEGIEGRWYGEDYEQLMHEPLDQARRRLGIAEPVRYRQLQVTLAEMGTTGL